MRHVSLKCHAKMSQIFIDYQLLMVKCPNVAHINRKHYFFIIYFFYLYRVTCDTATCPTH